jgi:TolB-like protein
MSGRRKGARQRLLAEGIQDEILTRLSKIADLKVISHISTQHYTSAPENLQKVSAELEASKSAPQTVANNR